MRTYAVVGCATLVSLFGIASCCCQRPGNQDPIIASFTATPDQVAPGGTSQLVVEATDPDGDTLSYSYTVSPAAAGAVTGTGASVTFTASATAAAGTVTITVTVRDSGGGEATASVGLTISAGGCECILYGSATKQGNRYVITPDAANQAGSAWSGNRLDLTQNADLEFAVYLGSNPDGGEGMAFVIAASQGVGNPGQCLGYGGLAPSIAVELDTVANGDLADPPAQHVAMLAGGVVDHASSPLPVATVGNLKDGQEHQLRITWNAETHTLRVYLDGNETPLIEYVGDIAGSFLGGATMVEFGFSAGTSELTNEHYLMPLSVQNPPV